MGYDGFDSTVWLGYVMILQQIVPEEEQIMAVMMSYEDRSSTCGSRCYSTFSSQYIRIPNETP